MPSTRRTGLASIVTLSLTLSSLVAVLALTPPANAQGRAGEQLNASRLIDAANAGAMIVRPADESTIARRRTITFDVAGLNAIKTGRNLSLNLFDDIALPVQVDRFWVSQIDTFHWQGHVLGEPARSVLIVLHRGAVWASIEVNLGGQPKIFRIRSHKNIGQVAEEVDQDKFSPCGCGEEQRVPGQGGGAPIAPMQKAARERMDLARTINDGHDDGGLAGVPSCVGPTIDVMVLYSPEAREIEGGTGPIEALIIGLEDATNNTYINSAVVQRIDIVHFAETAQSEDAGFGNNLSKLRDTSDGFFDEAHALRDQYGADLVDMLISHTNGGICGIGYLMTSISVDFAENGFTVTNTNCAQGGFTFQHELGHNMGCHHDHDNSGPAGAFTWSHGHRFTAVNDGTLYRTVMAYAPGFRIGYFSNPDILYQGTPTGVPIGTPDTEADNAATLNATGGTVAQFRNSVMNSGGLAGGLGSWPTADQFLASDAALGDRFGTSVAVSGSWAIVGAYTDDTTFTDTGSAYIFHYDAKTDTWSEFQKLVAPDAAANDRFGVSVDIVSSVAGDVCVIGSYLDDNAGGLDAGAAYVFRRNGSNQWVFEFKLMASDKFAGDFFGRSVAIARAGSSDIIAVGAALNDDGGSATGSAYVFRNPGAGWVEEQKILAGDAFGNDQFGQSVDIGYSLSDSSQWLIVGSWLDDDLGTDSGSAYLYRKDANWTFVSKLLASDGATGDQVGFEVAIAFADAVKLAYAGAWKHNHNEVSNTGSLYVFADSGSGWAQETEIVPADTIAEDHFGVSVDASEDGCIVGAYLANTGALDAGAGYVFRRTGAGWAQEGKLFNTSPFENEQAGFAVAIDPQTALVGDWQNDAVNTDSGSLLVSSHGAAPPFNDCNHNGIADECDILNGTSPDVNHNGIPDECEPPPPTCPGDVAPAGGNGFVDVDDLIAVILAWGPCGVPTACPGDANASGAVDVDDLILVILHWGACP